LFKWATVDLSLETLGQVGGFLTLLFMFLGWKAVIDVFLIVNFIYLDIYGCYHCVDDILAATSITRVVVLSV
jgi:hypothetical protein